MYYYVYKITTHYGEFKDNIYIGKRKCRCLPEEDPYLGSGSLLYYYKKLYPNTCSKEILCYCKDKIELTKMETYYIAKYFDNPLCLNIHPGVGSNIGRFNKHNQERAKHLRKLYAQQHNIRIPHFVDPKPNYYIPFKKVINGYLSSSNDVYRFAGEILLEHYNNLVKEKLNKYAEN